jgi:hypothetical protein
VRKILKVKLFYEKQNIPGQIRSPGKVGFKLAGVSFLVGIRFGLLRWDFLGV